MPILTPTTTPPFTINNTEIQFFKDIAYGEHDKNKFDLFLPENASSDNPVPLVIFIHGGAYVKGDKDEAYGNNDVINNSNITDFLDAGIAFASINYRLMQDQDQGVVGSLLDGSKALQFIRHHADTLMIDPSNIALSGESAGAYMSLLIALIDDMADPSTDAAGSESTKPLAVYAIDTQSTLNANLWDSLVFHDVRGDFQISSLPDELRESMEALGGTGMAEAMNAVDILQLMDKNDPLIYVENANDSVLSPLDSGDYESSFFHHPFHVRAIKEKSDTVEDFNILYKYNDVDGVTTNTTESGYDFLKNSLLSAQENNPIGDIVGTDSADTLSSDTEANLIQLQDGDDTVTLVADSVWSSGYTALSVSNDASVGTNQKISLDGFNRFSDVIDGGADIDSIILTSGNDAFFIDDVYSAHHSSLTLSSTTQGVNSTARMVELETINAGEGNDIVDLTSTNFVLTTGVTINGEAGNDNLWGSNGSDIIDGGTGDDSIFGGTGSDTLTGGTGADTFQFTVTAGSDVITDFDVSEGGDSIQLYYRAEDNHTNADLSLANGVLTWDVDNTVNDVVIDLSATVTSSDLNDLDALITFVEIV